MGARTPSSHPSPVDVGIDSVGALLFLLVLTLWLRRGRSKSLKFRSMCSDAEQRLDDLQELNETQGHAFKIERDPRVARGEASRSWGLSPG